MSSKSTIILTDDNEHWYSDCNEPNGELGDTVTIHFLKSNIEVICDDEDDLIFTLKPGSHIADIISIIKQER